MLELLGLLGGLCFSISSIPMAYKTLKLGRVEFIPPSSLWAVFIGAILMLSYLTIKNGFEIIVMFDYFFDYLWIWNCVILLLFFEEN